MQKLAEICVRRPVFASVLVLLLLVFGVLGYAQLGVDRFPDVDIPSVTVTTLLPGASPEEIETEITDKIEEAVNTVSGIDDLRSVSSEGVSQVYIAFVLEKDVDVASQEVRDRVNRILGELPEDAEQPSVEKLDPDAAPILALVLSGPGSIRDITEIADKVLRRQLESISGVGQVTIIGGQQRQINVEIDPVRLRAHNLTVADVARALQTQNIQVPGGTMKQGPTEYTLRTLGRVTDLAELSRVAVANRDGHSITIADVGVVEDGSEEPESVALLNETPAVLLNIRKQSGTNTIAVVDNVMERLTDVQNTLPTGCKVEVVRDQSTFIRASTRAVQEHLVLGSILAAIVVYFFLANARTTIIASLAIPTSIISTFALMWFMGYTMNVITLLALTLSVGIVIDDAIVVLENIFRHIEEKGKTPFQAALDGTREIGLAVMVITMSLVAVFMPIAFMGGIVGRFMSSFGMTMSFAIMVSLFVSFSLTPMLAARWLRAPDEGDGAPDNPAPAEEEDIIHPTDPGHHHGSKSRGLYHWIETAYLALLAFSLRHRWLVVLTALAALASTPVLFSRVNKNFLPVDDESQFEVTVKTPEGNSLARTREILTRLARDIRQLDGVRYTLTSIADNEQRLVNQGTIFVRLVDTHERNYDQVQAMEFVRKEVLPRYADDKLRTSVQQVAAFSGGGNINADVQFVIGGPDIDRLSEYSTALMDRLRGIPGAVDVDRSLSIGKPEYGVRINREKAAELGVSVNDIASSLRLLVAGDKVSDYYENGELYEVQVRASADARNAVDRLKLVTVPSTSLGAVPLIDVVMFEEGTGPAQIDRLNRKRQVTITCNVERGYGQQAVIDALNAAVADMKVDPQYSSGLVGRSKELARAARNFLLVFVAAFVFMYLVIAAQFESWLHPVTILLSLPLTLPFALLSLVLSGESLNIFSTLGVLVLFAVVKKNAILQIDHTNQLREAGMERNKAILAANRDRLRPILMTTIAFVAGMVPLFLSSGAGAGTNKTISIVVIGGQTLSLLLTLIATPVAYSLFDDMGRFGLVRRLTWPLRALAGLLRGRRRGEQEA